MVAARFSLLAGLTAICLVDGQSVLADECQPWTWMGDVGETGDIVCRLDTKTGPTVNYYTCKAIADRYQRTIEDFFFLNLSLGKDCSNIQPNTTYCVDGCEY